MQSKNRNNLQLKSPVRSSDADSTRPPSVDATPLLSVSPTSTKIPLNGSKRSNFSSLNGSEKDGGDENSVRRQQTPLAQSKQSMKRKPPSPLVQHDFGSMRSPRGATFHSPTNVTGGHPLNPQFKDTPFLAELAASIHLQLESYLHLVGAESGCVLLLEPSADLARNGPGAARDESESRMSQTSQASGGNQKATPQRSGMGFSSDVFGANTTSMSFVPSKTDTFAAAGSSNLHNNGSLTSPRSAVGGLMSSMTMSSNGVGGGGGILKGLFKPLAMIGKQHPCFSNESLQAGVVATGIGIHSGELDPFMCFPMKSGTSADEWVGVLCAAHRSGKDPHFTELDEGTSVVMANALGLVVSKYPAHFLNSIYDGNRLKQLGVVPTLQSGGLCSSSILDTHITQQMRSHVEQRVLRQNSAHFFAKRGISHERFDIPTFHQLQEISDYSMSLEAVVEAQRKDLMGSKVKEQDAVHRLQLTQRELTIAQQTAGKLQEANDGFKFTTSELQRQLEDQRFERAMSKKLPPTQELEMEVRAYLNKVHDKMAGKRDVEGVMLPPGGMGASLLSRQGLGSAKPRSTAASGPPQQRPAPPPKPNSVGSKSARPRSSAPPSQRGGLNVFPQVTEEVMRLLKKHNAEINDAMRDDP